MTQFTHLHQTARAITRILVLSTLLGSLSACTALMVGGTVAAVAIVATDRRSSGTQLDDEAIEFRASALLREKIGERGHINVTSYNKRVLLTGEVSNEQVKKLAEQLVFDVENVKLVINELAAMDGSSLQQRSSDAIITGRVKASMVDTSDIRASNLFKVVTERGVVYLMGRVTQREAERGTDIARGVSGVVKVVRSFEIINEEEARRQ